MNCLKQFLFIWFALSLSISHASALSDQQQLQGQWYRGCNDGSEIKISFKDSMVTRTRFLWLDASCFRRAQTWEEIGTFEVQTSGSRSFLIVKWTRLNVSPARASVVDELNKNAACGLTDWKIADTRNVILECLGANEISETEEFEVAVGRLGLIGFGLDVFSGGIWSNGPFILSKL